MRVRIQKWGNSLAVRIPRAFAEEAGLRDDSPVELQVIDGQIIIKPASETYQLDDLLARINEENLHGEIDSGDPTGNEVW